MSTRPLTKVQRDVACYLHQFTVEHGFPPTMADIAKQFGYRSANAAHLNVCALIAKGSAVRVTGVARGSKLTAKGLAEIDGMQINLAPRTPRPVRPVSAKQPAVAEVEESLKLCTTWGVSPADLDEFRALKVSIHYDKHRQRAKTRRIAWAFTPATWWRVWKDSGCFANRGTFDGQFVMARHGDVGPYAPWNVRITTCNDNLREAHVNRRLKATGAAVSASISTDRAAG